MRVRILVWFGLGSIFFAASLAAQEAAIPGAIALLPGYHHQPQQGIDSRVGTISKPGGIVIEYDVGEMAGDYTSCKSCGWTKDEMWRKQQDVNGQKAVLVFTKARRLFISFPAVHANFYATISTEAEMADMLLMVLTFDTSRKPQKK